jgi:hypothetical protein
MPDTIIIGAGQSGLAAAHAVLLATGYRPDLGCLTDLGALDSDGNPVQRKGISTIHSGLGYVGLEWRRSLASATLRGVGRDARFVVRQLGEGFTPSRRRRIPCR